MSEGGKVQGLMAAALVTVGQSWCFEKGQPGPAPGKPSETNLGDLGPQVKSWDCETWVVKGVRLSAAGSWSE